MFLTITQSSNLCYNKFDDNIVPEYCQAIFNEPIPWLPIGPADTCQIQSLESRG